MKIFLDYAITYLKGSFNVDVWNSRMKHLEECGLSIADRSKIETSGLIVKTLGPDEIKK